MSTTTITPPVYRVNQVATTSTSDPFTPPTIPSLHLSRTDITWLAITCTIAILVFIAATWLLLHHTCTRSKRQKGRAITDSRDEQRNWSRESVIAVPAPVETVQRSHVLGAEPSSQPETWRHAGTLRRREEENGTSAREEKTLPPMPSWPLPPWPLQAIRASWIGRRERYHGQQRQGGVVV